VSGREEVAWAAEHFRRRRGCAASPCAGPLDMGIWSNLVVLRALRVRLTMHPLGCNSVSMFTFPQIMLV
jgi:hypothetical protein